MSNIAKPRRLTVASTPFRQRVNLTLSLTLCVFGAARSSGISRSPRRETITTIVVDLVRPISGPGEVTLRSADALEQPDINLNFFSNDLDTIAMREGMRFSYNVLTKGDGFKDFGCGGIAVGDAS